MYNLLRYCAGDLAVLLFTDTDDTDTMTSPTALTLEGILIPWCACLFTGVYSSDFFMVWDCLKVEEVEKLEISRPSSLKG